MAVRDGSHYVSPMLPHDDRGLQQSQSLHGHDILLPVLDVLFQGLLDYDSSFVTMLMNVISLSMG